MKKLVLFSCFLILTLIHLKAQVADDVVEYVNPSSVTLQKLWSTDNTSLVTPESVLYNEKGKHYFVSCINGVPPTEKDGDGYIAKIGIDGEILEQYWVVNLSAPKGMAIDAENLYVTDITDLVIISLYNQEVTRIPIKGAAFLNDIARAKDGSLYFSDSNTNTIHMYKEGKVSTFLQDEALGGPNGIYIDGNELVMASFGSGQVYTIAIDNPKVMVKNKENPGGDGVEKIGDGFLISNWNGEVFFYNRDWEQSKVLDTKPKSNAADIAINRSEEVLLVPEFFGNKVTAYKIIR